MSNLTMIFHSQAVFFECFSFSVYRALPLYFSDELKVVSHLLQHVITQWPVANTSHDYSVTNPATTELHLKFHYLIIIKKPLNNN